MRASAVNSNSLSGTAPRSQSENNQAARQQSNQASGNGQIQKTGTGRHHSGSKFTQNYTQQLKKQVQNTAQANNIDPVSAKQYLQNYLSDPQNPNQENPKNGPHTQQIQFGGNNQGIQNVGAQNQANLRSNYASHGTLSGAAPKQSASLEVLGEVRGQQQRTSGSRNGHLEQKSYSQTQKLVLSHKSKDTLLNANKRNENNDHTRQRAPSGSSDRHRVSDHQHRASSSNQMKRSVSAQNNTLASEANPAGDPNSGLNRTYVRPSSKQRQNQHLGSTYNHPQNSSLGRGHSPQTHSKTPVQMGGTSISQHQNQIQGTSLKSYLDNQLGHLNPNQVVAAASSQKNLPRKKRIASDNNTVPNQTNVLQSAGRNATGGKDEMSRNGPQSRNVSNQNKLGQGGSLPPMHQQNMQVLKTQPNQPFNASATMVKGQSPHRALNYPSTANNAGENKSQPQSYLSVGATQAPTSGSHIPTKPRQSANTNLNQHHNQQTQQSDQNTQIRPQNPPQIPQAFQQGDLFLNVDSSYNNLLMQMIQPNKDQFDFDGTIQYVMNASELSNQALAKLLYSRKAAQPPQKVPISIPQTLADQKAPKSRNATDQGLAKGGMAGQSKVSFFNTKRQFKAETLTAASSDEEPTKGLVEQEVRRDEYGQKITTNSSQSFYAGLRQELTLCADDQIKQLMPDYQQAKYSAKRNGIVAAYGANTNQGIVRNYNEDRVAIILNIMKPKSKQFSGEEWPKCSFFGIYDGHGGNVCADFLRDYLHQFIIKDKHFPKEPIKAIKRGFKEAEKLFLEFAEGQQFEVGDIDRSGSCAIVALIIDDVCYIGNTGDSRAVMSADGGKQVIGLSNDHKPTDDIEMERILSNNGRIYQNASIVRANNPQSNIKSQIVLGPHRVFPGRLSVCRTFGDIEAKLGKLDGNAKVVIADPDVTAFRIDRHKHDFIMIGCDGIYDKLENRDCVHLVWQALWQEPSLQDNASLCNPTDEETTGQQRQTKTQDERRHKISGLAVDAILKVSAVRRSCDNITAVVIAFDNFYRKIDEMRSRRSEGPPDYSVLEEIEFLPTSDDADKLEDPKVIYIENEDILESANEASDTTPTQQKQRDQPQQSASSVLFDSTGDHSFPKNKQQPNSDYLGAPQQQNAYVNQQGRPLGGGEKILSEIAEEDSVSIISGRPSRVNKQSQAATPITEPIANSFLGSVRVSQNLNRTRAVPGNTDNPLDTYQLNDSGGVSGAQKVSQGGNKDEPIQSGSLKQIDKRPPSQSQNQSKNNPKTQSQPQLAPPNPNNQTDLSRRPPSQQRSGSSQQQRRPASSKRKSSDGRGQVNEPQQFIVQKQTTKGQQSTSQNNLASAHYAHTAYGYAQQHAPHSQTAPHSHQTSSSHANQPTSLPQRGQSGGQSMGHLQRNDHHQITAGDIINAPVSHQIQVLGSNSSASLYQQHSHQIQKKRRSSNQGSNQQQQQRSGSNPSAHNHHKLNQNSGMSSSSGLLAQNAPNSGHYVHHNAQIQGRSSSNKSENSFPKKAKTQQPGKLAEIFRQVEGNYSQKQVNLNQTSALSSLQTGQGPSNGTHHYVPKGSLTSNSQLRALGVPAQLMHAGGTQVQNIQIKPISASKRKNQTGPSTGTFGHGSNVHKGGNQTGQISISNILNSRQLKEKQLNQTTTLNHQPQHDNNSSQNQLISQYLAQVNNSQEQRNQNQNTAAYQSKSTRTGSNEKSPGVLSRAQRVQMSFNTGISSSKTLQAANNNSQGNLNNGQIINRQQHHLVKTTMQSGQQNQTKTEKSRNAGMIAGSQGTQGGLIPKWQSLTAQQQQLRDSGSLSGPNMQNTGVFTQKKRKSNH